MSRELNQRWREIQHLPTPEGKNYRKAPDFAAPTDGMEKLTFDSGPGMNPGEFKYNVNKITEFMEILLKIWAYYC